MESVVFGNNKLVAMGSGGTFLTSPDGITWTTETSGTTASLTNSFYDGGKFVVVGSGGSIFTSNGL
jgi:hypothetical protein